MLCLPHKGGLCAAVLLTTAAVHSGASGGAVLGDRGQLLGLVTSNARHVSGVLHPSLKAVFGVPLSVFCCAAWISRAKETVFQCDDICRRANRAAPQLQHCRRLATAAVAPLAAVSGVRWQIQCCPDTSQPAVSCCMVLCES